MKDEMQLSIFDRVPRREVVEETPRKVPKAEKRKDPPDPDGVVGNWRLSLKWNNFLYSGTYKGVSKRCARYKFITNNRLEWKVKNLIHFEMD